MKKLLLAGVLLHASSAFGAVDKGFKVDPVSINLKCIEETLSEDNPWRFEPTIFCSIYNNHQKVGFVRYAVKENEEKNRTKLMIYLISVDECYRRKNIGKTVVTLLQSQINPHEIIAHQVVSEAAAFWFKCGFHPVDDTLFSNFFMNVRSSTVKEAYV